MASDLLFVSRPEFSAHQGEDMRMAAASIDHCHVV
jgi:hypothetical protein